MAQLLITLEELVESTKRNLELKERTAYLARSVMFNRKRADAIWAEITKYDTTLPPERVKRLWAVYFKAAEQALRRIYQLKDIADGLSAELHRRGA